jgi:TPR repeat protein
MKKFKFHDLEDAALEPPQQSLAKYKADRTLNTDALDDLERLANLGSPEAMRHVGSYFETRGADNGGPSFTQALAWYKNAFDAGSFRAVIDYARILEMRKEYKQLHSVLLAAVDRGYTPAMCRLARLANERKMPAELHCDPITLLERAAELGNLRAQWDLVLLRLGKSKDKREMMRLLFAGVALAVSCRLERTRRRDSERLLG